MKRLKLLIGLLLAAAIAFSVGLSTLSVFADTQAIENAPTISTEEDFDGTSVLVTMTEEISEVNKVYDKSFFGGIEISSIEDLSTMTGNIAEKECFDESKFKQILQLHLPTDSKDNVLEAIDKLEDIDGVLSACPNYYASAARIPNDDYFDNLWGMERESGINAIDAWDITTGSHEIKVGIIDTGIAYHPDLIANLAPGWDFVNNNNITNDDPTGHGTHVAGTIGAVGNNGVGVVGVNWEVTLVPLQVATWNTGKNEWRLSNDGTIQAINWAKNNDIPILNYSAGAYESRETIKAALDSYSGLFVCSAGNDSLNVDVTAHYPSEYSDETNASYSNVSDRIISVGSIDTDGDRSSFSNYGEDTVSIYAPGGSIYSTLPNETYGYKSGTSMAAPHVTGVAALLLSAEPTLTAAELKEIILNNADTITISTPDGNQSVKKLNAYQALNSISLNMLFGGGTGKVSDPFIIRTVQHFKNIEYAHIPVYEERVGTVEKITYSFKLESNLVLPGDWFPFEYQFAGRFDGGGHYITYSMTLTEADLAYQYQGLFGFLVSGARIENLELRNCSITNNVGTQLVGNNNASIGILSGSCYGALGLYSVEIINPTIECNVANAAVGGISGTLYSTRTENCVVEGGSLTTYSGALGGFAAFGSIGYIYGGRCSTTLTKNNYTDSDLVGQVLGTTDSTGSVDVSVTINRNKDECVAAGTLITLADGRQVPVESLTGDEMLLVWNLYTGQFDVAPIIFIDSDPQRSYPVITLTFSDGTSVKVISEHGFWDYNLNRYVYLDENAAQYIGHWFNKVTEDADGDFVAGQVQLTGVSIQKETTSAYSPVTYGHLCYFVNGMLSMPGGISGLFNIFEVNSQTMRYDEDAMAADIAQYGLYTYDEFAQEFEISEEAFEAFSGQYLKVALGKGMLTEEQIASLIARYGEMFGM